MKRPELIQEKIHTLPEMLHLTAQWRAKGRSIAFTNGVFDLLHRGHIASLSDAATEADYLIVGVNSDASVKRLKGDMRPVYDEQSRCLLLASLLTVDAVILFEDDTPLDLIKAILPDVLVKGGDYKIDDIAGAKEVLANGGRVLVKPILPGYSTSNTIRMITGE